MTTKKTDATPLDLATQSQPEDKGPGRLGNIKIKDGRIDLESMADLWSLANVYVAAGTVPADFRGSVAKTFVALQTGAEVGIQPMQALKSTMLINGYPSLFGDGPIGLVLSSGLLVDFGYEYVGSLKEDGTPEDDFGVRWWAVRKSPLGIMGKGTHSEYTFTVADAKRARLWGKAGPWSTNWKRMLLVRARAFVLRDSFSDVLGGYSIAEELLDTYGTDEAAETQTERMLAEMKSRRREVTLAEEEGGVDEAAMRQAALDLDADAEGEEIVDVEAREE
jgi:hypothetical protein